MSDRCTAVSIVVSFYIFTGTVFIDPDLLSSFGPSSDIHPPTLTLRSPYPPEVGKLPDKLQCNLTDLSGSFFGVKSPSLESFIQASTTDEDQELRLRGLAVTSNLKDACQPLNDVSKANIQVNKIALVTLENETESCSLQDLAVHAQNSGYSVLIYFKRSKSKYNTPTVGPTQEKILIPVIISERKCKNIDDDFTDFFVDDSCLVTADQTNVKIRMQVLQSPSKELSKMAPYLNRLYYWFLVGPIITVVWMILGTKKFCLLSGGQQVNDGEGRAIRTMEEGENRTDESQLHHSAKQNTLRNHQERHGEEGEEQPLLTSMNNDSMGRTRGTRCVSTVRKCLNKAAECFGYMILIIAALPVGISIGGLSFFRFDEGYSSADSSVFINISALWWSVFQIYCFFVYSRFTCKAKWTVPTKFSKLIRSDWFASNIYLLVFGMVLPYCSFSNSTRHDLFGSFAIHNTLYTFCNMLFLIILNKHKVVTRYVFYISVCVICAYVESDIVALFYFTLNSQGSLNNFKLTALRTAAIGLTLVVSFRTSMHIIRKLTTPRQSLFEGLGEQ